MEYCCDVDIGHPWILKDFNYFKKLTYNPKIDGHFQIDLEDLTEDFKTWADSIGCKISFVELFYRPPNYTCEIHADVITESSNAAKLNWVYHIKADDELMNIIEPADVKSTMVWYESTTQFNRKNYPNPLGKIYTLPKDESLCQAVCSHEIKTPSLVNVSKLHNIVNPTNYQRWCISIVFLDPSPSGSNWFARLNNRLNYDKFKEILTPWVIKKDT